MRRLPVICAELVVVLFAASAYGQTLDPRPEIDLLTRVVEQMSDQATGGASLSTKQQERLKLLLGEQRSTLKHLKAKYSQDQVRITRAKLASELAEFFKIGAEVRRTLISAEGGHEFKATEYSPDPAQCAKHCEETCGYNSLGEKVCWYRCYYCCGKGGC